MYICTPKQYAMHFTQSYTFPNKARTTTLLMPIGTLCAVNVTDDDGPNPKDAVNREIFELRHRLGKQGFYLKEHSVKVTEHCTTKFITLQRHSFQGYKAALPLVQRFCASAEFLYIP